MNQHTVDTPTRSRLRGPLVAPLVLPAVVAGAMALLVGQPVSDWVHATAGGAYLLDGHLTVYADMPQVQMGPLALLLAGLLPGPAYMLAVCALLPLLLWLATSTADRTGRPRCVRAALLGLLLAWPWAAFGVQGHADDALVALGVTGMLAALATGRESWLVATFLLAIAGKPTAILFLPLALLHSRRAGVLAAVLGGLLWAPFVLSDLPGFLAAGRGQGDLWPYSLPDLLGGEPHAGFPHWLRPVQLVGGLALCWWLARRAGAVAAVVGVVAFRVLAEPGTWNYYCASLIAAALVFDLQSDRRLPWATMLSFAAFLASLGVSLSPAQGTVRLLSLLAVLAVAMTTRPTREARHALPVAVGRERPDAALSHTAAAAPARTDCRRPTCA